MEHNLMISVSRKPQRDSPGVNQAERMRERCRSELFGESRRITIIVPDSMVSEISITEEKNIGGKTDAT